jgi:hypothetical protein
MPNFFTFYFSIYDTLHDMVQQVHVTQSYMMRRPFVSGIAAIIRITSHSCDEAGAGWVLAWNWLSEGYSQ